MSRTEGVSLPRLPRPHTRVTSPAAIRPHQATRERQQSLSKAHRRALSEPSYTAYIGSPRQDVPCEVYRDAAMFDEVFDKKGALLLSRNTPKIVSPLNALQYSSLHDPHCQKLFLNNKRLRTHLVNMGLITCDLKVVASTSEQRQKIRAHELLERREQLTQKLEEQEQQRVERLQRQMQLPQLYRETIHKEERRQLLAEQVQRMKLERVLKSEEEKRQRERRFREEGQRKLKEAIEMARLRDQARRNGARAQQEIAEMIAYEKQYGKFGRQLALWHRESDEIHNKMIMMERKYWARMRQRRQEKMFAEAGKIGTRSSSESSGSLVDVESVHDLHPSAVKPFLTSQTPASTLEPLQPQPASDTTVEQETVELPEESADATKVDAQRGEIKVKPSSTTEGQLDKEEKDREEEGIAPAERSKVTEGDESSGTKEEGKERGKPEGAVGSEVPVPQTENVVILDREDSSVELTKIILEALRRDRDVDADLGYLQIEEFIQVLNSRDLGLQLNEGELLYIAEQMDINVNGWIPLIQMVPELPPLLLALYNQRAEQAMQHYGSYLEEQWCQIYLSDGGVAYFNKLTGVLQFGGRPEDFRHSLKDEVFEESIVDFFETADSNKDGVLDYNDFYALLVSPMVSTRVYSNQIEELLQVFESNSIEGLMTLDQFGPVAKMLLIMIYQNAYPDVEDWIELQTRKYGTVLFNKQTGEVASPASYGQGEETATTDAIDPTKHGQSSRQQYLNEDGDKDSQQGVETPQPALRKRKKHNRRVSWSDDATPSSNATPTGKTTPISNTTPTPTERTSTSQEASSRPTSQTAPPPLRRRRSKSQENSRSGTAESANVTADSANNSAKEREEAPSETMPVQNSDLEDHITVPEQGKPENSIPEVESTSTSGVTNEQASSGDGQTDGEGAGDHNPDTNMSSEAKDIKEPIPINQDPIPEESTKNKSNNVAEELAQDGEPTVAEQTGNDPTNADSEI